MYGIIIVISLIIGLCYIYKYLKRSKIPNDIILLYLFMLLVFIVVGGKEFTIYTSKEELNIINAGFSSYGGAIGASVAVISFVFIYKKKVDDLLKSTIIALPLIYSISKIACFIAGCCYGIKYDGLFHVYSKEAGFNTFPVQIIEKFFQ